jgi:excisionase family DNA binding protein
MPLTDKNDRDTGATNDALISEPAVLKRWPALAAVPAAFVRPSARVIRVMELLDVDESTVRRLIDRGEIEAHGVGKRGIRVYLDSVRDYQDARAIPPKGGKPKLKAQRSDVARAAHRGAEAALRKSGIIP